MNALIRDAAIVADAGYAALCIAVIAMAALGDRFGRDDDRRNRDDDERTAP